MIRKEQSPNPTEAKKPPYEAIHKIIGLYLLNNREIFSGEKGEKLRDGLWRDAASEFTDFSDKITELGKTLKDSNLKKKKFPDITKDTRFYFVNVEQGLARDFLGDILLTRITPSGKYMDTGYTEAREMTSEITGTRTEKPLCSMQFRKTTIEQAISSVLQRKLKLKSTPQPK